MSKEDDAIDSQGLFQQFAPLLLFDGPIEALSLNDQGQWWTIAEQILPANRDAFWKTIKRWTREPQLVIPPVDRAEIGEEIEKFSSGQRNQRKTTMTRILYPKFKAKDSVFTEKIDYFETEDMDGYEGRVEFHPVTPGVLTSAALPFYYPKVRAYRFVYQANVIEIDTDKHNHDSGAQDVSDEEGVLRIDIIPIDAQQPAILNAKMQYAMKSLLRKLFKWCIHARLGYKKRVHHDLIVPKDTYMEIYTRIKSTYADDLFREWTEQTDPQKFVFEDIGIASFLLSLWAEEEKRTGRKPTFVDLGCGNGLLTYLLVSEGYSGFGVDLADRKIWAHFSQGKGDILRMATLSPAHTTYPDTDWIIGNHADELVPWVPLIAAKSGEHCKFMVIPCCFHGLDGKRTLPLSGGGEAPGSGRYRAYTNYVKEIAEQCGFHCEEEYLRIPSTKNIAIIGRLRHAVDPTTWATIARAGESFIPRKSDREKEALRQVKRKARLE